MRRIKITLDYVGSAYHGWQRQAGEDTVQERVEDALFSLTGERLPIIASGRTDAGVHAIGQVAHFDSDSAIPVKNFVSGLNHFLPPDIRVLEAFEPSKNFHARYSAVDKTYRYVLYEADSDSAIKFARAVRVGYKLDEKKMNAAAKPLLGEHDFTSFMSTGSPVTSAVRTISRLKVTRRGKEITVTVTANGFLYNMVRLIVGVLVRAGRGEIDAKGVEKLLEARDKTAVREVMPACGLYLVRVRYKTN